MTSRCGGIWLCVTVLAVLIGFGCGRGDNNVPWSGPPAYGDGAAVFEFAGWEHCGWQDARFLVVSAEVIEKTTGQAPTKFAGTYFVRDPTGVVGVEWMTGTLELDAELPRDAAATGFRSGERALMLSSAEGDRFAYVADGERVERWPRFDGGCD